MPCSLVLSEADVGATLAPLPALRLLVLARQPAADPSGFGPYLRWAWGRQGGHACNASGLLQRLRSAGCIAWPPTPSARRPPMPCSAHSGAAWDATSVAALMQLARTLPQLTVQLERVAPPGLPPCACGHEDGGDPAALFC